MKLRRDQDRWTRIIGHYIRDLVFGANDGIVTTFAVVAGVRGAGLSTLAILALGFANLAGDGLSMAVGNYLGIKSEEAVCDRAGYRYWPSTRHAAKHGSATWIAFTLAGLIPLLPYMTGIVDPSQRFWISVAITCIGLFAIGAMRTLVTMRSWFWSGLEMLIVGALAGTVAFLAGLVVADIEAE